MKNKNYLMLNGVKYFLTAESETTQCVDGVINIDRPILRDISVGDTCKIGNLGHEEGIYEFIVCEHTKDGTVLLLKDLFRESERFGAGNNYNGSYADKLCEEFADKLAECICENNIVPHTVDLTADDGLKDYGTIERRVSLFTANQCRKYVEILDKHKIDKWWWTATPYSTPKHGGSTWVKCVSPHGDIDDNDYNNNSGVRPFCILNSNIFVSV